MIATGARPATPILIPLICRQYLAVLRSEDRARRNPSDDPEYHIAAQLSRHVGNKTKINRERYNPRHKAIIPATNPIVTRSCRVLAFISNRQMFSNRFQ
jgi:hypothetical protein